MNEVEERYFKLSFVYSFVVHLIVFVLLLVSLSFEVKSINSGSHSSKEIVQAVAIDKEAVQKEVARIKQREEKKRALEVSKERRLKRLEEQAKEKQRVAQHNIEKMKLQQKELRKKQLTEQHEAEKKLAKLKKEQELAKKRLADLKKKPIKKTEPKGAEKSGGKVEQDKMLAEQLAKEQQQLAGIHDKIIQNEIARYKALILNAIGQHWLMPMDLSDEVSAQLLIKLAPDGVVLDVRVLRGSGYIVLDRSVINAIWKASPLPVPTDAEVFEKFRELRLTVRPEGILAG